MDSIILRNKRPGKMPLASIKDIAGKPVSLAPHGYHGFEAVVPAFYQNHPDVIRLAKAGWLEIASGPGDGEQLGKVDQAPPDSPLKSAEALGVPPGDGPVVPADPNISENVFLGDPSNPLPPDMNSGADHVEEHILTGEGGEGGSEEHHRSRRKKHD